MTIFLFQVQWPIPISVVRLSTDGPTRCCRCRQIRLKSCRRCDRRRRREMLKWRRNRKNEKRATKIHLENFNYPISNLR